MKEYKTTHHTYAAWNFDREIADLNKESQAGWQLMHGGAYHSKFRYDAGTVYRYALDYNTRIDDPTRYREIFREQGWEYVNSTFNGWHYFRKPYDPALPEEAYIIYTDRASESEMKKRWTRLIYSLGAITALLFLAYLILSILRPEIALFAFTLVFLVIALVCFRGGRKIHSASQKGSLAHRRGLPFLIALLILYVIGVVFGGGRQRLHTLTSYTPDTLAEPWVISTRVKLPDIYRLSISVDAAQAAEVALLDEDGAVVRSFSGTALDESVLLFLTPGDYTFRTSYLPGAAGDAEGHFEYILN